MREFPRIRQSFVSTYRLHVSFNFFLSLRRNRRLANLKRYTNIRFNIILHDELLVQNFIRSRRESLDSRRKFETSLFVTSTCTKLVARENLLKLN